MRYALALVTVASPILFFALNARGAGTAQARVTTDDLPDLVVNWVAPQYDNVEWCKNTILGAIVNVQNVGAADAGEFVVALDEWQQMVPGGLLAGDDISLFFAYPEGYEIPTPHVLVDATFVVAESDENNNEVWFPFPSPTAPPTCTPAPTPTATATPTRAGPVGGSAELGNDTASTGGGGSSGLSALAIAGAAAGSVLLVAAGGWYARRRYSVRRR